MIRFVAIALIIVAGLTIYSLIDCARTPESQIRSLPRWFWLMIIIFVPGLGSIAWIIAGRPGGTSGGSKKRVIPPDDNPDFLKKL